MKLSQIVTRATRDNSGRPNCPAYYSWVKSGMPDKAQHLCLVIRLSDDLLQKARYREGDKTDPVVDPDKKTITFALGSEGWSITNKRSKNRSIKFSHKTAEKDLAEFFPVTGNQEEIKVLSVDTGVIVCKY